MITTRLLRLAFLAAGLGYSQQQLHISRERICSWNEDAILPEDLYKFPPDGSTTAAVNKIMKYTGLEVNFELVAANVPNAVATMDGTKRLILYNQLFMRDISKQANSNWASISILAHEIGHHLEQHTLGSGGVKSEQELAADKFSGDILFKMGASIDEARAAMESRPETKSPYYPKKAVRLIAIGNGWIAAQELAGSRPSSQVLPTTGSDTQRENDAEAEHSRKVAAQAESDRRAAAAQEERDRKAAEQEERDRKAEEKAERQRKIEEREEREQEKAAASRGCYDGYGRRWCSLAPNLPLGRACYCNGVPGSGVIANP